jgi:hypothetical protein
MRYELATLTIKFGTAPTVIPAIDSYVKDPSAEGTLLGCWLMDIGELNQIVVLRSFADDATLAVERLRALNTTNPFYCGDNLTAMQLDAYAPFHWMAPVKPGAYGSVYEIRSYKLKHGGVPATMALWEKAVPARAKLSPLLLAMYALDGAPRYTHIWPYQSLAARSAIRAEAVATGVWPPKGGPEWLTGEMRNMIGLPTAISPLQ